MYLNRLFFLACAAIFSTSAMAASIPNNPDVKNGLPCFKEICIGDELQDLSHIHWSGQVRSKPMQFVVNQNLSDLNSSIIASDSVKKALAVYMGSFSTELNSKMVELLGQVDAFCKNPMGDITGHYTDPSKGFTTMVVFRAIANKPGEKQKLVATSIGRYFDTRYSSPQIDALFEDLSNRYSTIKVNNQFPVITRLEGGVVIRMPQNPFFGERELMNYPGCTKKLDM